MISKIKVMILFVFLLTSVSQTKELKIVLHNKVVASIVLNIAAGFTEYGVFMPHGTHAHHFSLKPSHIKNLNEADLFFYNGLEMDVSALKLKDNKILDISKVDQLKLLPVRSRVCCDHLETALDSHFWLDLDNIKKISRAILNKLSELDPDHKDEFEKNYKVYIEKIDALEKTLSKLCTQKIVYIMEHDTTNYIDSKYGTRLLATLGFKENASLNPKNIKDVLDVLKTNPSAHLVAEFRNTMPDYKTLLGIDTVKIMMDPATSKEDFLLDYLKYTVYAIANYQEEVTQS